MADYWIGVDGGGTGTRVVLALPDGRVVGRGLAGPSALGQGIQAAWAQILLAIRSSFEDASLPIPSWAECVLGAGLSGVHNVQWRAAFLAADPGFASIELVSDATTMLLGAHGGLPGVMVAAGTGSVGESLHEDGRRLSVGGWGFPVGDEGSGAWIGLQAARLAQAAMDGRTQDGALTTAVLQRCGTTRELFQSWCARAGQFEYASLAPLVFETQAADARADGILVLAALELEQIALALDPKEQLPIVLCGSVAERLQERISPRLKSRLAQSQGGALEGALALIRRTQEVHA